MRLQRIAMSVLAVGGIMCLQAMDGVCIATIVNGPTYKQWMAPGKLVKYEIEDNYVVRVDTLNDVNAGSPRINMSGTYYAYIKTPNTSDFFTRKLVIKPLYGNPTSTWEISLKSMPSWLWWLPDGSMMYTVYPLVNGSVTAQNEIRKITFGKSGSNLVVTDRCWAKVGVNMQGGFIAIDGTGTKLIYTDGQSGNGGFIMDGDSTHSPTNANIENSGCGYSLSPTGDYFTQWAGGHSATTWNRWDRGAFPLSPSSVAFTTMVDSGWPVIGANDPEKNLEVQVNGQWIKDPIGICGADNIWAQNSEYWHISEIGAGWLEIDADCYNAIAISWKWKKTINISKIMPVNEVMSGRSRFRGITFTGGTQRSADHPTLWCSNQEDVTTSLWHYASSDRASDNQYWSDLLGLPLSAIPSSGVKQQIMTATDSPRLSTMGSGLRVVLPGSGYHTAIVTDVSGRAVLRVAGEGRELRLPRLGAGTYVVEVSQGAASFRGRFTSR